MIAQLDGDYVRRRPAKAAVRVLSWALFEGRPVTSRGHWINPIVLAWLNAVRRLPASRSDPAPVYVVGTGRSGTTVLGKVLSLHPDVGFLNEPKAMWYVVHEEDDLIGNFGRGSARYRLDAGDATREIRERARRTFGAYARLARAPRVLDKYPEMIFRIPFVREIFPDARFLFLVRDGWDTVRSMDRWSDRHGERKAGERRDWWGVDDRKWRLLVEQVAAADGDLGRRVDELSALDDHRDRAAVEWLLTMREGMRHLEAGDAPVEMVRFEDLTREPGATLERILAFCDLPYDETMMAYGRGELAPVPHRDAVALHPAVEAPFLETMERMGYTR